MVGWLVSWWVGGLVGWVGWLGWVVDGLVGWLVGGLVGCWLLFAWLIGC